MLTIGPHLSVADGYRKMGEHAVALGASTLAFFTRNPRGGQAKALDEADIRAFRDLAADHEFGRLVAHASYTLNPAAKTEALRNYARQIFQEDLTRMESLPGQYYNLHPGSHVGQGVGAGVAFIAEMLNESLRPEQATVVLLETMSGRGSEIGGRFEELRAVIDAVAVQDRLGVCLDTCHVWAAGYDIARDLDGVLTHFDKTIGLPRLKAIHLNDSQHGMGEKKDRHANLGEGTLGMDAIVRIVRHPALRDLPFILETPGGDPVWRQEIKALRAQE